MNLLHPVYHGHSYQVGSIVDIERFLPESLKNKDLNVEDLLSLLSEPPKYIERIAPVSTQIGKKTIYGKNCTELMIKGYRLFLSIFTDITAYVRQTLIDSFGESGMIPFLSVGIAPDTMHRIIEMDNAMGENTYSQLLDFYEQGIIAPCATSPFHAILPLLNDFDIRLSIKIGLEYYWKILQKYHEFIRDTHKELRFVATFWLPEGGYNTKVLEILYKEFAKKAKTTRAHEPHLVILLDNSQAVETDNDVLMKSWNVTHLKIDKKSAVSVLFRDRNFSEWVTFSNPSVKKLLDRTIAKMDADLNAKDIDYSWTHFEDIEALTYTVKASTNFEQKITKLIELGYLPVSPDMFVRRKINRKFGRAKYEPRIVHLKDNTSWNDWHPNNVSLGRWLGLLDSNAEYTLVDENHPYMKNADEQSREEPGPQCWKIAFNLAMEKCAQIVKGSPAKRDGMFGVLCSLLAIKDKKKAVRNVEEFLVQYSHIHWKEHFLFQNYTEADLYLPNIVADTLFKGIRAKVTDEKVIIAGVAAQAYYFALTSHKSSATLWENMDQRAVYQNVVFVTLAMVNAIYSYHWIKKQDKARKIIKVMKDELFNFSKAYDHYNLAKYGVTKTEWKQAIKSEIEETELNVVARAARRTAARHLRPLGYKRDFPLQDERLSTNTGHIWSAEVEGSNFNWENTQFCGLKEE